MGIGAPDLTFFVKCCINILVEKIQIIHALICHLDNYSCRFLRENMTVFI
jgi:hypothetical protein